MIPGNEGGYLPPGSSGPHEGTAIPAALVSSPVGNACCKEEPQTNGSLWVAREEDGDCWTLAHGKAGGSVSLAWEFSCVYLSPAADPTSVKAVFAWVTVITPVPPGMGLPMDIREGPIASWN